MTMESPISPWTCQEYDSFGEGGKEHLKAKKVKAQIEKARASMGVSMGVPQNRWLISWKIPSRNG